MADNFFLSSHLTCFHNISGLISFPKKFLLHLKLFSTSPHLTLNFFPPHLTSPQIFFYLTSPHLISKKFSPHLTSPQTFFSPYLTSPQIFFHLTSPHLISKICSPHLASPHILLTSPHLTSVTLTSKSP
jgi:hypothetical protein